MSKTPIGPVVKNQKYFNCGSSVDGTSARVVFLGGRGLSPSMVEGKSMFPHLISPPFLSIIFPQFLYSSPTDFHPDFRCFEKRKIRELAVLNF